MLTGSTGCMQGTDCGGGEDQTDQGGAAEIVQREMMSRGWGVEGSGQTLDGFEGGTDSLSL